MIGYLTHTAQLADRTPRRRNRIIDLWRVTAITIVVIGHWLAASIWLRPDGEIALMNSLEWIPYSAWVTWLVQVMPIFFLVGGYANAKALARVASGKQRRREWIALRVRRLFTPVVPLLIVWTLLIVVMRPFVPDEVLHAGAMAATVPLWFMAVYLSLVGTAPFTHRWWQHSRWSSVATLAAAAIVVDVARFGFDVPGIGWANFLFVWAAIHQIGYWWASRDDAGRGIETSIGWTVLGIAFASLVAVTWLGLYPVAMIGVPGAETTNMTPPTFALVLLGVAQAGAIWATQRPVARWAENRRVWHGVAAISGVIMTLYLWHLTAMALVSSVGLFTFGGAAFRIEPGTTAWWLTRPVWLVVLAATTIGLVAVFATFEWRISRDPAPSKRRYVLAAVLLTAGSTAAVSYFGLTTESATINWMIPVAAVTGAALVGALPSRKASGRTDQATAEVSSRDRVGHP